ncbi:alpha/beta hydrolase, partial [bacterium AH-315-K03]|nr:alpha/beta hydrolase [bacterium AH-315-K03]
LQQLTLEEARARLQLSIPDYEPPAVYQVVEMEIPAGEHDIPIRLYRPNEGLALPALVFFHGGGWALGDLASHDDVCRRIANKAQCIVLSVDYRLAPEYKYPAGFDDAYRAFCWVTENTLKLGIERDRIAIGGDSAGGNLAVAVALKARDYEGPDICFQMLWYPVMNIATLDTPSYQQFDQGFGLKAKDMQWFKSLYLNVSDEATEEYVSPLLAQSLSGLPKTYIATAGFDVLRDEGNDFVNKLRGAGIEVNSDCFQHLIHGFINYSPVVPSAASAFDQTLEHLEKAFGE